MGDPKKTMKHYERPMRLWDKENLEKERVIKTTYGLRNKRELWRAKTMLSKKRNSARKLLAMQPEGRAKKEAELLQSLARLGVIDDKASLDDILTLSIEAFLERRLQTIAWRKGLANTARQARQFITHGHIAIGGKKVSAPGYLVKKEEEDRIGYYGKKMVIKPVEKPKKAEAKQNEGKGEKQEKGEIIGGETEKREKKAKGKEEKEKKQGEPQKKDGEKEKAAEAQEEKQEKEIEEKGKEWKEEKEKGLEAEEGKKQGQEDAEEKAAGKKPEEEEKEGEQ